MPLDIDARPRCAAPTPAASGVQLHCTLPAGHPGPFHRHHRAGGGLVATWSTTTPLDRRPAPHARPAPLPPPAKPYRTGEQFRAELRDRRAAVHAHHDAQLAARGATS